MNRSDPMTQIPSPGPKLVLALSGQRSIDLPFPCLVEKNFNADINAIEKEFSMSLNTDVIDAFVAAFGKSDIDEIMSFFTPDAVYTNIPMDPPNVGREMIRKTIEGFIAMSQSIEFIVHHSSENPKTGVVMNERTDQFQIGDTTEKGVGVDRRQPLVGYERRRSLDWCAAWWWTAEGVGPHQRYSALGPGDAEPESNLLR
jgi:limonene-1,2-epoxide hydrolase